MPESDPYSLLCNMAYQCWLERGRPFGSPEVDWHKAQQLLGMAGPSSPPVAVPESGSDAVWALDAPN